MKDDKRFGPLWFLTGEPRIPERGLSRRRMLFRRLLGLPRWSYECAETAPWPALRRRVWGLRCAARRAVGALVRLLRRPSCRCYYPTCPRKATAIWNGKPMCAEDFETNRVERIIQRAGQ